jgi:hypothetical protein
VHAYRYPSTAPSAGLLYGPDAAADEILKLDGHPPQSIRVFEDLIQIAYAVDVFGHNITLLRRRDRSWP